MAGFSAREHSLVVSPMSDEVEASATDSVWRDKRLAKGTLAQLWDSEAALRQRMHDQDFPYLTRWLRNPKTKQLAIGVPSVKAMALNVTALETIAEWYCPVQPYPKAICIDVMRREAGCYHKTVCFGLGPVSLSSLK